MPRRPTPFLLAGAVCVAAKVGATVVRQWRRTRRYEIAETSMEPALRPGDYVVARSSRGSFLLGDVVIYPHPERPGFELVKRVVGLPGATVEIDGGRVFIDGAPLPEPWAVPDPTDTGRWRVRADEIFVMGDQRRRSSWDSRQIGPIAVGQAQWTLRARYWPADRIGMV
jgi:signal peptidase I